MELKKQLAQLGIYPSKKMGQNFLHDSSIIETISNSVLMCNQKNMIEIGPGLGAITDLIDTSFKSNNYKLIELDKRLYTYLASKKYHAEIFLGDCLKLNWEEIVNQQPFLLFGNLPYNIGTLILIKWINCNLSDAAIFMLQKEMVDRITSAPSKKTYSGISVITQLTCDILKLFDVPRNAFYPEPNVDSVVIKLTKKDQLSLPIQSFIRSCFAYKRKTLFNNLRSLYPKEKILEVFNLSGLRESTRAEELIPLTFVNLYMNLNNKVKSNMPKV